MVFHQYVYACVFRVYLVSVPHSYTPCIYVFFSLPKEQTVRFVVLVSALLDFSSICAHSILVLMLLQLLLFLVALSLYYFHATPHQPHRHCRLVRLFQLLEQTPHSSQLVFVYIRWCRCLLAPFFMSDSSFTSTASGTSRVFTSLGSSIEFRFPGDLSSKHWRWRSIQSVSRVACTANKDKKISHKYHEK